MLFGFSSVFLFLAIGFIFASMLVLSRLIQPKGLPTGDKFIPYECGEIPEGSAWIRFNIRFYVIALIFIIFDAEIVFLLPWAVVFKTLGPMAFIEGIIFIGILVVGLAYVWIKKDLDWVKADDVSALISAEKKDPNA